MHNISDYQGNGMSADRIEQWPSHNPHNPYRNLRILQLRRYFSSLYPPLADRQLFRHGCARMQFRIYSPVFRSESSGSVLGVNLIPVPEFYF